MNSLLPLPRLLFGRGAVSALTAELVAMGLHRPLLVSDRGLERAGAVATVAAALPAGSAQFLDTPENPTAEGADATLAVYTARDCDSIVAVGGGSVIDSAKIVAALAGGGMTRAADILGRADRIGPVVAPLIAVPTTIGTGSESSPAAGLHPVAGRRAVGTRSFRLVPRMAVCDPDLARTLPPRLIAATGIDALSHCLEGYFAEPANPVVDAMALDGLARAFADIRAAMAPDGDEARASLMAAAFAGGAAIHKGLGPAHAIAFTCGDQHLHHGVLVAAALPLTVRLITAHAPVKAARAAASMGLRDAAEIAPALAALNDALGLPATYTAAGYRAGPIDELADDMASSPFNRTSPYTPTRDEYAQLLEQLLT